MSTRPSPETNSNPPDPASGITEIHYSLPEMLAELQLERSAGSFSQEKLHQVEIGKLFQNRKKRRVKKSA
ncbi:MAG: hypothetical protein WC661_01680 [Opitutaceae bacterium]|jgi:hypothetical protein